MDKMKSLLLTIVWTGFCLAGTAQSNPDSSHAEALDSPAMAAKDSTRPSLDSVAPPLTHAAKPFSVTMADSVPAATKPVVPSYRSVVDSLLLSHRWINTRSSAVYFVVAAKRKNGKEFIFYALCLIFGALGIFKTLYNNYFNNLFRVFFNTSIRQNQLTDQLLQAKLPSFILNIFFVISAGFYLWLLFYHYHPPRLVSSRLLLPFCVAGIGALYFVKYCTLKFIGWMSEMQQATDNYIFVIFLVNKIIGVVIIPFTILLAFSLPSWSNYIVIISWLTIGLLFLSRYVKTYGILEYRFPLEPFHFILYVAAVEILPLCIVYKLIVDYLL